MNTRLLALTLLLGLLAACNQAAPATPTAAALIASITASSADMPVAQATLTPFIQKANVSPSSEKEMVWERTSTPTPSPTPTYTPTATIPLPPTLTLPADPLVISLHSMNKITQLGIWGKGSIYSLAWAPDGKQLALGTGRGIYFYDAKTLKEKAFIETPKTVSRVAFSPDGRTLASGSQQVVLWDIGSGKEIQTLEGIIKGGVDYLVFSPDGTLLAAMGTKYSNFTSPPLVMHVWQTSDGKLLHSYTGGGCGNGHTFMFSPDSQTIVGEECGYLFFLKATTGDRFNIPLPGDRLEYFKAIFTPDGKFLIASTYQKGVIVIALASGEILRTISPEKDSDLILSPNGEILGILDVWDDVIGHSVSEFRDVETGQIIFRIEQGFSTRYSAISFSPDSRQLAIEDSKKGILFLNTDTGQSLATLPWSTPNSIIEFGILKQKTGEIQTVLARNEGEGLLSIVEPGTGKTIQSIQTSADRFSAIAFHPNGQEIAIGVLKESISSVQVYDILSGKLLKSIECINAENNPCKFYALAFSMDGQGIATDLDGFGLLRAWEIQNGKELPNPGERLWYQAKGLGADANGHLLEVTLDMDALRIKDLFTGQEQTASGGVDDVGFCDDRVVFSIAPREFTISPDGRYVALGCAFETIPVWDLHTRQLVANLEVQEGSGGDGWYDNVTNIAFGPYGYWLVSASTDNTVFIWDISTGQAVLKLGETAGFLASPDGRYLATIGYGTLRLWGLKP